MHRFEFVVLTMPNFLWKQNTIHLASWLVGPFFSISSAMSSATKSLISWTTTWSITWSSVSLLGADFTDFLHFLQEVVDKLLVQLKANSSLFNDCDNFGDFYATRATKDHKYYHQILHDCNLRRDQSLANFIYKILQQFKDLTVTYRTRFICF